MKAIILAAGYGKRMRPLTNTTHKTLLEIGGRTVIQWIIDPLLANGITEIVIVTGYMADELQAYLSQTYCDLPIQYVHNERYAQTNNIYSMAIALEQIALDSDIILIECDLIFDEALIERLLASEHANVALVDRYKSGMDGTVVQVSDGIITNVIPPHLQGPEFNFNDKYKTVNIYRFSQEFCANTFKKILVYYAKTFDSNIYYELILGILIYLQREVIHAEILDGERWAEIDDPNDLNVARFMFEDSSRQKLLDASYGGFWNYDLLDYCYIRNMHFPTGAMLSELRNNLPALVQNYGSAQQILNQKLAYYLLCDDPTPLMLLNGASQAYPFLGRYFDGKRVLIPSPSFGEYRRIFPNATPYFDEVGLSKDTIIAQANEHDVVVFINPNNPTGSTLPTEWIYELAIAHPNQTIVLDESFIEFAEIQSILTLLRANPLPNVILLKSLSKSLGVPGIRLGYLYSFNAPFMAYVKQNLPIWNMNGLAEYFLEIILKHRNSLQDSFRKTISDREQFARQLETLPIVEKVYPSGANFILVSLKCTRPACSTLVESMLLRHKIYIKDASNRFRGQTAYIRLAVRDPRTNSHFVDCLCQESHKVI